MIDKGQKDKDGRWHNGNSYESFVRLMSLKKVADNHFESDFPAYSPGGGTRAYGGHVYAQSALAAARTVKEGFVIHSITGHFTLEGLSTVPFIYRVRTIRDGGSYCQRQVDVWQNDPLRKPRKPHQVEKLDGSGTGHSDKAGVVCFTSVVSFKRAEPNRNERQHHAALTERFGCVLGDKRPWEFEECPGVDSPWYWEIEKEYGKDPFPGLKSTKVDMAAYNSSRPPLERRQLQLYQVIGKMPTIEQDANMHAVAHLYSSDRNGLFVVPIFLDKGNDYNAMASLSHTVIFHAGAEQFDTIDSKTGEGHWFFQELQVDRIGSGRALVQGKLWRDDGLHVATHFQDGLVRFNESEEGDDSDGKGPFAKEKL